MKSLKLWIPFAVFFLFVGLAAYQLSRPKDDAVASAMIGKDLPEFILPPALGEGAVEGQSEVLTDAYFRDGTPKLLNIWASWCLPCIAEAPQLEALKEAGVPIVGIAIRDRPEDVARFLEQHGNPYVRIAGDAISEVQLGIGSSGVPETFVIDGQGRITHQHIGDIRARDVPIIMEKLQEAGA